LLSAGLSLPIVAQENHDWVIEKISGGFGYASGLVWSREGFLLVADLPAGKVTRIDSKGTTVFKEGIRVEGMAWDAETRLYLCEPAEHRVTRIDRKGRSEIAAERFDGKRLNGPNGVAVSKNGHVWFTDPAFGKADRDKELTFYGVYHLPPKGELSALAKFQGRPNGIALSPDGRSLYVVDSDARSIQTWTLDKNGVASNQHELAKVSTGVPNGITVGPDGRLYVAARDIEMFEPSGSPAGRIELNEKPGDLAFADGEPQSLYVAARTSVYRVRFKPREKAN